MIAAAIDPRFLGIVTASLLVAYLCGSIAVQAYRIRHGRFR
jgi:hypothetical protein